MRALFAVFCLLALVMMILSKRHRLSIGRLLCLVLLVAAGCVSATPPPTLATANIGPPPVGYEPEIKALFDGGLKDPYSAVYTFQRPVRSWFYDETQMNWAVCGTLNAKNAFGGYVGARPFAVFYRHRPMVETSLTLTEFFGRSQNPSAGRLCAKWHEAGAAAPTLIATRRLRPRPPIARRG
jgi:hypothetical protein